VPDADREIDELYALPLEEFTSARNDLARRLKDSGDADAAAAVRGLAKPSVVVWAVNQLARHDPDGVRRVVEAGTRMREGQRDALAGGSAQGLERAAADERDAVSALARKTRDLLSGADRAASPSTIDRVATTLRAAAVDEEAAGALERGALREELEPAGFDLLAGMPVAPRQARPKPKRDAAKKPPRVDPGERRRRVAEAHEELKRARAAERDARRTAREARSAAEAADREAEAAADAVRAAEEALERARKS
jgi:hypothetical protein